MRNRYTSLVNFVVSVTLFSLFLYGCGSAGTGGAKGSYSDIYEAIRANDLPAVKSFLSSGVDVNAKDSEGKSLLHYAAAYAGREVVQFLIEKGADINARDGKGRTPMSVASQMGNSIAEEVLDRAGATE